MSELGERYWGNKPEEIRQQLDAAQARMPEEADVARAALPETRQSLEANEALKRSVDLLIHTFDEGTYHEETKPILVEEYGLNPELLAHQPGVEAAIQRGLIKAVEPEYDSREHGYRSIRFGLEKFRSIAKDFQVDQTVIDAALKQAYQDHLQVASRYHYSPHYSESASRGPFGSQGGREGLQQLEKFIIEQKGQAATLEFTHKALQDYVKDLLTKANLSALTDIIDAYHRSIPAEFREDPDVRAKAEAVLKVKASEGEFYHGVRKFFEFSDEDIFNDKEVEGPNLSRFLATIDTALASSDRDEFQRLSYRVEQNFSGLPQLYKDSFKNDPIVQAKLDRFFARFNDLQAEADRKHVEELEHYNLLPLWERGRTEPPQRSDLEPTKRHIAYKLGYQIR